jgi:hypothetical protein
MTGLSNDAGSGKVDDNAGSREIFSNKFWQPYGAGESLQGLGFAKAAQRLIYWGTIVAMGIGDVSRAVATKNHSSDERLPSSAHC